MQYQSSGWNGKPKHKAWRIYLGLAGILILVIAGALFVPGWLKAGHINLPGILSPTPRSAELTVIRVPSPEIAARTFLNGWQAEDYAGMYALLSTTSRSALPEDKFRLFYNNLHDQATLKSLDYRILSVDQTPADATVNFEVTLHSILVGDITRSSRMLMTNEDGQWKIAWDGQTVLPDLENGNTLLMHRDPTPRGNIYDRNGLALAADGQAVEIGVIPGNITEEEGMLTCLSKVLHKPRELIRTMYDFGLPDSYFPIGDVNKADIGEGCSYGTLSRLDGVQLNVSEMRYYYGGGVASNVVGYTRRPSSKDLANGYSGDALIGANGVEQSGEEYLAGRQGGTLYVVKADNSIVSTLAESKPFPAMDIYTTLNRDLQAQMEQTLMGPFTGAAVVLNRNTGEVLAMMSSPHYDSNYFNPGSFIGTHTTEVQNILDDPRAPLINRAAQGLYPLGSVFKIITMSAALESGIFDATSIVYNDETGYFTELEGFNGTDWTVEKEMKPQGKENLTECLERSTNTCFWHVALNMYYKDAWLVPNMAMAFGLGQRTGITGVADEAGLLPNPGWKHDTGGGDWTGGDALNQAVGQGMLEVTPLQVADFVAAVGNGGTLYRPQILSSIRPADGDPVYTFAADTRGNLPISQKNLQAVQTAMVGVIMAPKGTARGKFTNFSSRYKIAGKTGTAQTPLADPDAWFVAYTYNNFPNKPDIAVAVIVENIGEGSTYAAPMARRIMEIYFDGRPESRFPWESTYGMRGTDTPVESETPTETPTETPLP